MPRSVRTSLMLGVALAVGSPAVVPAQQAAGPFDARIEAAIAKWTPEITALRHRIHQNPELGNQEQETAALVVEFLRKLGFTEIQTGIATTGITAVLRGGRPGPFVAVRADMDALPVVEDTDLPFRSTKRGMWNGRDVGIAHACGHDIHVAVQLGVAAILSELRADLPGSVQFIFQPAEEGVEEGHPFGGAQRMLAEGIWRDRRPDAVFGLHAAGGMPVGMLSWSVGPLSAASDRFVARVHGVQGHGARPQETVDPIVVASQVVLGWQTIASRNVPPVQSVVITTGMFQSGDRENIIPAMAELRGTVRTHSPQVRDLVERRMREVIDGIAASAGARAEFDYRRGYPSVINDTTLAHRMRGTLERAVGPQRVIVRGPEMTGEDFSYFANETPGHFFGLGTLVPGTTSGPHHSPTFRADDSAIPVGMRAMTFVLVDYLVMRP
ncbi:MAG: M20 family metallopeptidase [Gemmatimonadales bacterium]